MKLGTLFTMRFKVLRSIPVKLSRVDGQIIAEWVSISEFGTGRTMSEALEDLARGVRELYAVLHSGLPLGRDLQRVKRIMRRYFKGVEL